MAEMQSNHPLPNAKQPDQNNNTSGKVSSWGREIYAALSVLGLGTLLYSCTGEKDISPKAQNDNATQAPSIQKSHKLAARPNAPRSHDAKAISVLTTCAAQNKSISFEHMDKAQIAALSSVLRSGGFLETSEKAVTTIAVKAAIKAACRCYGLPESDVASPALLNMLTGKTAAPVAKQYHPAVIRNFENVMFGSMVFAKRSDAQASLAGTQDVQIMQIALLKALKTQSSLAIRGAMSQIEIKNLEAAFNKSPGVFNATMENAVAKYKAIESARNISYAQSYNHDGVIDAQTFFSLAQYDASIIPNVKSGVLNRNDLLIMREVLAGEVLLGKKGPYVAKGDPAIATIQSLLQSVSSGGLKNYQVATMDEPTEAALMLVYMKSKPINADWGNFITGHKVALALVKAASGQ